MTKVYFFVSAAFVFNDKILPVILELARQGYAVRTVVFDKQSARLIRENQAFLTWLTELTTVTTVVAGGEPTPLNRLATAARLLWLYLGLLVNGRYLAFFDTKKTSRLLSVASRIARFRGRSICYVGRYFDYYPGFEEERAMEENKERLGKRSSDKVIRRHVHDKILVFDKSQIGVKGNGGPEEYLVLNHPKMQPWWRDFMAEHPPVYDNEIVERADSFISVFLTHQGNYFFEEGTDLDGFISEIIRGIRAVYPDTLIVFKPKVTVDREWLAGFFRELGETNVTVSYMPVSVLSLKSICGITTCQSSAQFEFLLGGTPWIEYCRYSTFWKEYYPPLTFTNVFGGEFVRYVEELSEALENLKGRKYDFDKLRGHLGLEPQAIDFDFFYKDKGAIA